MVSGTFDVYNNRRPGPPPEKLLQPIYIQCICLINFTVHRQSLALLLVLLSGSALSASHRMCRCVLFHEHGRRLGAHNLDQGDG